MISHEKVVEAARVCLGTPFVHEGRMPGKSLDCIGLILWVGETLQLKDIHGVPILAADYHGRYSEQPSDGFLHVEASRRLKRLPRESLQPGCVVALRSPAIACHVGIVGLMLGQNTLIHVCSQGPNRCIEESIAPRWLSRVVEVFDFPGVGAQPSLA